MKYEGIERIAFEDLHNVNILEQVADHMCGFDGVQRGKYFVGQPIRRTKVEVRLWKLRN